MLVKTLYAYTPVPVIFSVMVTRTKDLKSEVTNQDQKPLLSHYIIWGTFFLSEVWFLYL